MESWWTPVLLAAPALLGVTVGDMRLGPQLTVALPSGPSVVVTTSLTDSGEDRIMDASYDTENLSQEQVVFADLRAVYGAFFDLAIEMQATAVITSVSDAEQVATCLWNVPTKHPVSCSIEGGLPNSAASEVTVYKGQHQVPESCKDVGPVSASRFDANGSTSVVWDHVVKTASQAVMDAGGNSLVIERMSWHDYVHNAVRLDIRGRALSCNGTP